MPEPILTEPVAVFLTIMAVILITPLLSERLRLPSIVGLILGGALIGPYVLRLLTPGRTIILLSTVGLIYLMFTAGLEIDLEQFKRVRNKSIVFGLLTFGIPQVSGIGLGRLLGLDWPGAILLGSIYASHTLIAFPIVSKLNIMRNEAVAVTIGATVFTDIGSLLVLAILAGTQHGVGSLWSVPRLIIFMIIYTLFVLFVLPRLGKIFFKHFTGKAIEFQFVLVTFFVAALLAEQIGMHAIVGAFLAGLAINYTLPQHSHVVGQVIFIGESFFIPIFLIYIGMIIDPQAMIASQQSLLIGIAMTAAVYATKFAAAWLTARIFHYSKFEMLTMWGLSQAQAAATLAAVLVGTEVGLLTQEYFNGAVMMILFTTITSPLIVQRVGLSIRPSEPPSEQKPLFKRILVPIANPQTQERLINLASILARAGEGVLMPIHVATEVQGRVHGLEHQRQLMEAEVLHDAQTDVQPIARVDSTVAKGVIRAAIENEVTLILTGWRGQPTFRQSIFGTVTDEIVWSASIPVLVSRITTPINSLRRIVIVVPRGKHSLTSLEKTFGIVEALSKALNIPMMFLADQMNEEAIQFRLENWGRENSKQIQMQIMETNPVREISGKVTTDDLIVVSTIGSRVLFRSGLASLPEELAAAIPSSLLIIHYP